MALCTCGALNTSAGNHCPACGRDPEDQELVPESVCANRARDLQIPDRTSPAISPTPSSTSSQAKRTKANRPAGNSRRKNTGWTKDGSRRIVSAHKPLPRNSGVDSAKPWEPWRNED